MITVLATREGLAGQKTATSYVIDTVVPFVALPHSAALRLWIWVLNPRNQKRIKAITLDIGPWETADPYVWQPATLTPGLMVPHDASIRPHAETGMDTRGRKTNGAGIDLGEAVWKA